MSMVTVECSDGVLIDVDRQMAVSISGSMKKRLEEKPPDDTSPVLLDNITSTTLMKVLEFCNVHTSNTTANLKSWDEKFVRLEPGELCELASAAYHLEIKPLVDLTCKAIAKLLKGKPPAEIRRTFNILYDFSPGDDVPPPTMRDKLRTKLHYKQKEKPREHRNSSEVADTRSLDDLVSFIDGGQPNSKKKTKTKKSQPKPAISNVQRKGEHGTDATKDSSSQPGSSPHKNKELYARIMDDISDDFWETEDEESIDPEVKAAQDREVEEFRRRLEGMQKSDSRPKVSISFDTVTPAAINQEMRK